jgi:hypothetical protein
MFKILSTYICLKNIYIKCNIWRVAVRPSYIWDTRFLKVKIAKLKMLIFPYARHNGMAFSILHFGTRIHIWKTVNRNI